MAFTDWAALKTSILDDLADGSALTKSYSVDGRSRTFQTLDDVMKFLQFCDMNTMAGQTHTTNLITFARPD